MSNTGSELDEKISKSPHLAGSRDIYPRTLNYENNHEAQMKKFALLILCLSFGAFAMDDFDKSNQAAQKQIDKITQLDEMLLLKSNTETSGLRELRPDFNELAEVVIVVNRASAADEENSNDGQTMKIYHNGVMVKQIDVSTGTWGHATPTGYFRPTNPGHLRIYQEYHSGAYSGSPMKWAVFFNGGVALHSTPTSNYRRLGSRASHGCVRMTMENAQEVNELIRSSGLPGASLSGKWYGGKNSGYKFNRHFKGLERTVPTINRYTGELSKNATIESVDTVIIVVDQP